MLAAGGYPDAPRHGDTISGLPASAEDLQVFHAGTSDVGGRLVTCGGRVLCVTALGESVRAAQKRAYQAIESILFDGMQYRSDIGRHALHR